jgi:hypothetical protein
MKISYNSIINAKGLYATKKYIENEIIYTLTGKIYDYPTRETIHIGNNKHIYDEYGKFINHSFTPTVKINNINIIALRNININDEITFNYNENEINMAAQFYVDNILISGKKV